MQKSEFTSVRDIKSKIGHSFGIMVLREFGIKFLAFAGQFILVRILYPDDFGNFAIITFVISFFSLFSDIGLSPAIIQRSSNPHRKELDSVFTLKMIINLFLLIFINISASYISYVYPGLKSQHIFYIRLLSLTLVFSAFRSLPQALLERELRYKEISSIDISGIIAYYLVSVSCAIAGYGLFSFVIGLLFKEISELFIAYYFKPWQPGIYLNLPSLYKMMKFGSFIQANGIANFIYISMIPFVGGMLAGPYAVGLLDWANNIVSVPESITNNFSRIAFSGFSRFNGDKKILSDTITRSTSYLTIISLYFVVVIYCFAAEGVELVFTAKWLGGVPALFWYAGGIPLFVIFATYGQGLLSLGYSRLVFLSALVSNSIGLMSSFIYVYFFGFTGIAVASMTAFLLLFIFYVTIAANNGIKVDLVKILLPKFAIALGVILTGLIINVFLHNGILILFIKFIFINIYYFFLMYVFQKNETMYIITFIKNLIIRK